MTSPSGPVILQVLPELDTGGVELSALEISQAVAQAGGQALVAAAGGRMELALREAGAELCRLPLASKSPVRMWRNAGALVALVRSRGIDLIHARSRAPAWSALLAARRTGTAFVTTYHGAYGQKSALKGLYNSVMARGDIVIANSEFTARLLIARHGTDPQRVRVIHRGVDMAAYDPAAIAPERIARLRRAWGVGENQRIVLQVARLTRWKGQDVLIRAAARLLHAEDMSDVSVVLAGDAQGRIAYERSLRALIATFGLEGRIILPGHCDDVPAACQAATVVVVASREAEAFGRASAEAQAACRPVIATDIGALPETLRPVDKSGLAQATGWLVPPDDHEQLADVLMQVLSMPHAQREAMGARGRAYVAARFTRQRMQTDTLAVYDSVLRSALVARLAAV
jgi:glycosyltransferase involved in cell wall biosynthesis